ELLVSRAPGYVLEIRDEQLDAERFDRLTREGRELLDAGSPDDAAAQFREALELWRGPALGDLAFEPFAKADVQRLEELRIAALEDRIDADLARGRHNVAVPELRELVAEHPLRERLRVQLMTALYRSGRQGDALEAYRDGRRILRDELGIDPGPALQDLERAILRQDPELGPVALRRPIVATLQRRWRLSTALAAVAGALAVGLVLGLSGTAKAVAVHPNSVAVIDPDTNSVAEDIPVGGYPLALAADSTYVYASNFGDGTISRIRAAKRRYADTS